MSQNDEPATKKVKNGRIKNIFCYQQLQFTKSILHLRKGTCDVWPTPLVSVEFKARQINSLVVWNFDGINENMNLPGKIHTKPVLYTAPAKYTHVYRRQNFDKSPQYCCDSSYAKNKQMSCMLAIELDNYQAPISQIPCNFYKQDFLCNWPPMYFYLC